MVTSLRAVTFAGPNLQPEVHGEAARTQRNESREGGEVREVKGPCDGHLSHTRSSHAAPFPRAADDESSGSYQTAYHGFPPAGEEGAREGEQGGGDDLRAKRHQEKERGAQLPQGEQTRRRMQPTSHIRAPSGACHSSLLLSFCSAALAIDSLVALHHTERAPARPPHPLRRPPPHAAGVAARRRRESARDSGEDEPD